MVDIEIRPDADLRKILERLLAELERKNMGLNVRWIVTGATGRSGGARH